MKLCVLFLFVVWQSVIVYSQPIRSSRFMSSVIGDQNYVKSKDCFTAYKRQAAMKIGSMGTAYLALIAGSYRFADRPIQRFSQNVRSTFSGRLSSAFETVGHYKVLTCISGGVAVSGLLLKDKRLKEAGLLSLVSISANDLLTYKLKSSIQRYRPNTGASPATFDGFFGPNENRSFPSAHTSNAFCIATIFASVYKDSRYIPVVAYSAAALVGISRIHDNAHWTSDVLAGAMVGFVTARLMLAANDYLKSQFERRRRRRLE